MSSTYTTRGSEAPRLDSHALARPQRWSVTHRGLEYPGEVVFAEGVDRAWGQPLQGDVCFRVVFYTVPRRIPAGHILDPRIAIAVPRRAADQGREALSLELQSVRESKERYLTGNAPEVRALQDSMTEQKASLVAELERRESLSYGQGRIYTQVDGQVHPSDVFVESSAPSWVDRLVQALYQQAYPSLPFRHDELPSTLTANGIETIYRGLFHGDRDAGETVAAFCPALGLTSGDAPTEFDATDCPLIETIGQQLAGAGGELGAQDVLTVLSRDHGLTRPLATLYLLAFVGQVDAELELVPGHSLQSSRGGPFPGDRVSRDLLGEFVFTGSVGDQLAVVRTRPTVDWNAVVPYASLVIEGLSTASDPEDIAEQEGRLSEALDDMGRRIEELRTAMEPLAEELQEDSDGALSQLDRLHALSNATDYQGFYTVARDSFSGPSDLGRLLQLFDRLARLADRAPAITAARRYLNGMTFGREHQELAVRRDAIIGRMGLDGLTDNPSLWSSVEESVRQLRREYADAYVSHHAGYHRDSAELVSRMERSRRQVEALLWFNEVPEFGEPLGTDIPQRFEELGDAVRTCTAPEHEVALDAMPHCQTCLLPLDEDLPRREAASVFGDVEGAMRVYSRRLSSEGVGRILSHPTREQLDKLINLVQISDLSVLANVLDAEVVEFLRRFVRPE